ncbi:membrane-associated phospholipid phosphatase [Algoriphagus iocasae]|uniref:Membrane-associated phospholipid phosphatase n=1 Tax=Algoriphagus iocasae TaxID=1836499 RepID=A0A841MNL3_9BACT|nr:PA-phosphatase [Algoriphagus iocasae]MBB6328553.1 membrane-associated phospholipid phosphatase [Algoriphagus iocasae]
MSRFIALFISVVFQPLLVPTLVFGLILFLVPEASSIPEVIKGRIFLLIVLSTLAIPMVTIFGLRLSGTLKSIHMVEIKDRVIPFVVTTIYFLLTTYFLHDKTELDPILWQVLAVISLSIVGLTFVTFFWKMSAHMTGMGGLIATVVVLNLHFLNFNALYPLLGAILLAGIVATCRLKLNAHKPSEIYVGLVYGFIICFVGFSMIYG